MSAPGAVDQSLATAKALHPSSWRARERSRSERHLEVVKPTRPPETPEAWSAGLWGSFA
ncbi:MAG: hypothetical protein ACR2HV_10340 [Acidimicrobiales bacterium]